MKNTLKLFASDGSFPSLFKVRDEKLADVKEDNILGSFKIFIDLLMKGQSRTIQMMIKDSVLKSSWNLPIFDGKEGEEEEVSEEFFVDEIDEEDEC